MKKIFILVILQFILGFDGYSQWFFNKIGPLKNSYFGFFELATYSKKNIWIRADSTRLSTDSGKTYKFVTDNKYLFLPVLNDSTILDIRYVPMQKKMLYHKSTDYGKTWNIFYFLDGADTGFVQTHPTFYYSYNDSTAIIVADSSKGCQEIWRTENAGYSWKRVLCKNINISYSTGLDAQKCSNNINGTIYKQNPETYNTIDVARDNGKNWDNIIPNIVDDITNIYGLAFSDTLNGLMVYQSFNNRNTLVRTEDGGKTWTHMNEVLLDITYAKATSKNPGFYFARYYNPTSNKRGAKVSFNNGYDWKILDSTDYYKYQFKDAENGLCVAFIDSFFQVGVFTGFPAGFASNKDAVKPLKTEVKIYPNPAKEILNIESSQDGKYECININGQIILSGIAKANQTNTLPISGLASGLYFLKFTSDNNTEVKKIIIE